MALLDWRQDPLERVRGFSYSFEYDPTVLSFNPDDTTLLCELRATGQPANCPTFTAGHGTTDYGASGVLSSDDYSVDQTGLTIIPDASGLALVTVNYTTAESLSINGERNFLALAFDLLVPLDRGAQITYSPVVLSDASLQTSSCSYTTQGGATLDCSSDSPSLSLRISAAPVPGPLALGGLPAMAQMARRLRQRLRCSREA